MTEWTEVGRYLIIPIIIQFILSLVLLLVVSKYPILLYKVWNWYLSFSNGFTRRKVKVSENYEFSYMERGNAKACEISLLLVHGFSSNKESWCMMGKYIPKRIHIVALDLPGHGSTTRKEKDDVSIQGLAKRIEQFVNAVGLNKKKYHIAGTSLGGFIAGIHATMFPKNVASALLICPAGIKSPVESEMFLTYEKEKKIVLLPETNEEFIQMIDLLVHKPVKFPDIIVSGVMQARRQAHDFYYRMLEGFMEENERYLLQERLQEIQTKLLVVWGRHDRALHVSSTDVIRKILPDVDIKILDDCGHSISLERPRKLANIVTMFLEEEK